MRFTGFGLALAAWLAASTFLLPSTPLAQAATWAAALAVAALAVAAVGRPGARLAISGVAALVGLGALLVPDLSTAAAVNDAIVAAILFAVSVAQPARAAAPAAVKPGA